MKIEELIETNKAMQFKVLIDLNGPIANQSCPVCGCILRVAHSWGESKGTYYCTGCREVLVIDS